MSNVTLEILPVLEFLQKTLQGKGDGIPEHVLEEAAEQTKEALRKQFNTKRSPEFRLRASNIGKAYCQLWHEKNGTPAIPLTPSQLLNFVIGDIVEVVYMAILKTVYGDKLVGEQAVTVNIGGVDIKGHTDLSIAGYVHDIKSASNWSFRNKLSSSDNLKAGDAFGYISQLLFYSRGGAGKLGGWFVMDKSNGDVQFTQLELTKQEEEDLWKELEDKVRKLNEDAPFERSFEDVPETYYGKQTGNRILQKTCTFCGYRNSCWTDLQVRPKIPSKSKFPPEEYYTEVTWEGDTSDG